ncbi:MAG: hypothetical protein ACFFC7_18690 [Candidatus Hermodarchaeota archaeon]
MESELTFTQLRKTHRIIERIINQSPQYIRKYKKNDQQYLQDFIDVISFYRDYDVVENVRQKFLSDYKKNDLQTYTETAFLWFADNLFQNYSSLLILMGLDSCTYLADMMMEAFTLIRDNVLLNNKEEWERLQNLSKRLNDYIDLSNKELNYYQEIYNLCNEKKLLSLNKSLFLEKALYAYHNNPFKREAYVRALLDLFYIVFSDTYITNLVCKDIMGRGR